MNLLTRLARELGAVAKPVGGRLVVVPKGEAKTVSGAPLPTVLIDDPQNSSGRVTIQERNDYQSVVAYWFNEKEQRKMPAVAGLVEGVAAVFGDPPDSASQAEDDADSQAGPRYIMRKTYSDQKSAQEAALAQLKKLLRGKSSMSISRPLTPSIVAEGRLDVRNHRSSANRLWQVESVTHVVGSGGAASSSAECVTPA
jgi:hypothetical protein